MEAKLPPCYRCGKQPCACRDAMSLYCGKCELILPSLDADSIDAVVTDPPAGIGFMGKHWDSNKGGRDAWIDWMAGIAAECLRVCKPGAHALVWSLPRTSHWTATAWENAGWQPRDRIVHCFGSGFPKSLDVSKAIDKAAGAEREVVGAMEYSAPDIRGNASNGRGISSQASKQADRLNVAITAPATDAAKKWDGWGSALKPAVEQWTKFQKPLTAVPLSATVEESTIFLEALLWLLSPAKFAESVFQSSQNGSVGACGSVRWIAAVWCIPKCGDQFGLMDTFNSPEEARTFWSIASLWKGIWDAVCDGASTYTTETATRLITALRILNSFLSAAIPESIILVAFRQNGLRFSAMPAENNSPSDGLPPNNTHTISALRSVTLAVLSTLVSAAESVSLSTVLSHGVIVPADAITVPQIEDWWLLRKPLCGTVAENVQRYGTGALNIEGCRVEHITVKGGNLADNSHLRSSIKGQMGVFKRDGTERFGAMSPSGRWPANLILSYPEDEYELRDDVTPEQLRQLAEWMDANARV